MKKEMNNKGFSLVELIIVIAIMAILIVVLAPQYLKYVEKSRNSTDVSNATEIVTAIQVYAADPDATKPFPKGESFEVDVTATAGSVASDTSKGSVAEALTQSGITITDTKCSSKTNWTEYKIKGKVEDNGSITFTYEGSSFSDAMKGKSGS
jgi:type IV pilus assembly protein PilA